MLEEFWDTEEGGFFYTGKSHEELIVRSKDYLDNATPSGNSVAAEVLLHLASLTANEDYARKAVTIFRLMRDPSNAMLPPSVAHSVRWISIFQPRKKLRLSASLWRRKLSLCLARSGSDICRTRLWRRLLRMMLVRLNWFRSFVNDR